MISRITPNFTPRIQTQNNQPSYMAKTNYKTNNISFSSTMPKSEYVLSPETVELFRRAMKFMEAKSKGLVEQARLELAELTERLLRQEGLGGKINAMVFQDGTSVNSLTNKERTFRGQETKLTFVQREDVKGVPVDTLTLKDRGLDFDVKLRRDKDKPDNITGGSLWTIFIEHDGLSHDTRVSLAMKKLLSDLGEQGS